MDKLVGAFSGVLKATATPTPQQPQQGDRQYLRLPLESARKLRWFEKADLQALTKNHFREKRELLDTVAALKKVLLRNGLEEAKLDAEVAAQLRTAEELAEEHEGVASVLLAALEPQVQELRFENDRLKAAIKTNQHTGAAATASGDGNAAGASEQNGGAVQPAAPSAGVLAVAGPLPRRLEPLDLAQVHGGKSTARMDPLLRQQIAALEAQCEQYGKEVAELKASLAKQQQAAARRRGPDGGEAARAKQMQEAILEMQEAAREEARKAARAEARATRLEGELKTLQTQNRTLTKDHAALQQQLTELQEQMEAVTAETAARVAAAAAAGEEAKAAAEAREEATGLRQALAGARAELATAQASIARLETDVQLTQQREAAAVAALAEAEALAHRSDELAAANLHLGQLLADSKAELDTAAYYKKLCGELTEKNARVEEQLLSVAALLSASECRVADLTARLAASDEQVALSETRARVAESNISAEVERRCGVVLSCRALWPQQLKDEVAALESRLAELTSTHDDAVRRADAATAAEDELREALRTKEEELAALQEQSAAATTSFAAQLQQLRESLAETQARAAGLQDDLTAERTRSKAREEAAVAAAVSAAAAGISDSPAHGGYGSKASGGGGSGPNGGPSGPSTATTVMTPKWQVQNKVGSGSLYNLNPEAPPPSGLSAPTRGSPGSVDVVYMKNVLFKFLEAHLCNKVQERDVLLPAVATLLQATQEEYAALQKIVRATLPPSRQMLSVLGLSR